MSRRTALLTTLCLLALTGPVAAALIGSEDPYRLRVAMDNASGLRAGSDVRIGDIPAGKVASVELDQEDRVIAVLELEPEHAPVGRDASVAISSLNLLGHKYVDLDRGDPAASVSSGHTIDSSRVTASTDLDQVLNVLDGGTRARLAILMNEAGRAVTGRQTDISQLLRELPTTTAAATRLLEELVSDTRTLREAVGSSERFITRIARERGELTRLVNRVGQVASTVASRRSRLRQTLAAAPGTLRTLQGFLSELRATTGPLGPAARELSGTSAPLAQTLSEVSPFQRAARPSLVQARAIAPSLTELAVGATPVLSKSVPAVSSLERLSRELTPVSDALDGSAYNLLATVHNWARAIQFRDGHSHVFNGSASVTPETLAAMVRRLQRLGGGPLRTRSARDSAAERIDSRRSRGNRRESSAAADARSDNGSPLEDALDAKSGAGGGPASHAAGPPGGIELGAAREFLDFLLGS